MPYIGNQPAPTNVTSENIIDGTITNVDINASAAIAATKIAGLSTVATTGAYSDVTGTPTIPVAGTDFVAQTGGAFTGDVSFGDNDKAIFGDGSDLQIYHDSVTNNSYIAEAGVGDLVLQGTNIRLQTTSGDYYVRAYNGGAVNLYHNNAEKLATTSTGVDITGTLTSDGFTADGDVSVSGNLTGLRYFDISNTGSTSTDGSIMRFITQQVGSASTTTGSIFKRKNGEFRFANYDTDAAAYIGFDVGASERMRIDSSGDVNIVNELKAGSYNETYAALSGTSPTVNCETGNVFSLATTGNTTFTFSNPPASGTAYGFTLKVTAGGTHTLTWPSSVDWAGGTAPDAPASGETNVLVFITHDGGTTWYGFQAGAALA